MRVAYDPSVEALYFRFCGAPFARHVRLDDSRGYDLATDGRLIGVEILLNPTRPVDLADLPEVELISHWLRSAGHAVAEG